MPVRVIQRFEDWQAFGTGKKLFILVARPGGG